MQEQKETFHEESEKNNRNFGAKNTGTELKNAIGSFNGRLNQAENNQ